MLQYKDYLSRLIQCYDAVFEDDFVEVAKLFPNVQEIDWDDYYPAEEDLICYILRELFNNVGSYADIDDYSEYYKSVSLSYIDSLQELEEVKKCLDENGWIIKNYEDLKAEIEETEKENKECETKENLIQEIRNKATLDQLQEFCDSLT